MSVLVPTTVLRGHRAALSVVRVEEINGRDVVLSGDIEGDVRVWDVAGRRVMLALHAHARGVLAVRMLRGGECLLSHGRDGLVRVWDSQRLIRPSTYELAASGSSVEVLRAREPCWIDTTPVVERRVGEGAFCRCDVLERRSRSEIPESPAEVFVACAENENHELHVWELYGGTIRWRLAAAGRKFGMCMAVAVRARPTSSELLVVSAWESGDVVVWNCEDESIWMQTRVARDPLLCLALKEDCTMGVVASAEKDVAVIELDFLTSKVTVTATAALKHPGVSDVCLCADDMFVATAGWDRRVRLYRREREELKPLAIARFHADVVTTVNYGGRLGILVSGGKDCKIAVCGDFPRERFAVRAVGKGAP